jgi:hypothetical protein
MIKPYWFVLCIVIALVAAITFAVRETLASSIFSLHRDAAIACQTLPSRYSIHVVEQAGMRVISSEDGPTGVDGGLEELNTTYRICART